MYGQTFYEAYVHAMADIAGIGIDEEWEDLSTDDQDAYDTAAQAVIDGAYEASAPCVGG